MGWEPADPAYGGWGRSIVSPSRDDADEFAHAFRALGVAEIHSDGRTIDRAEDRAAERIRRQRRDGIGSNRFTASQQDDPLVATPFANGGAGDLSDGARAVTSAGTSASLRRLLGGSLAV